MLQQTSAGAALPRRTARRGTAGRGGPALRPNSHMDASEPVLPLAPCILGVRFDVGVPPPALLLLLPHHPVPPPGSLRGGFRGSAGLCANRQVAGTFKHSSPSLACTLRTHCKPPAVLRSPRLHSPPGSTARPAPPARTLHNSRPTLLATHILARLPPLVGPPPRHLDLPPRVAAPPLLIIARLLAAHPLGLQ